MKRKLTIIASVLAAAMIMTPMAEAQGRGRNQGGGNNGRAQRTEQRNKPSRPGNSGRPDQPNRPNQPSRPNRPNQPNRPNRPNGPGRPNGPSHDFRPNRPNRPHDNGWHNGWNRPAPRPPKPYYRPYMPANRAWRPPVPPPNWRWRSGGPSVGAILGITLGTAFNISLNALLSSNYNVAGYNDNVVYLTSVPMWGYTWPNATLNYVSGALRGSEFTYSTPGYDMSRYNMLYNSLMNQYGYPVSVQNGAGGSVTATWWGQNNGYVTLSYYPDYANNGTYRYYTTLSLGN